MSKCIDLDYLLNYLDTLMQEIIREDLLPPAHPEKEKLKREGYYYALKDIMEWANKQKKANDRA